MGQLQPKRRARSPEAKSARRAQILDAASALLEKVELDTVVMDEVARKAGVAKGTLYLYFRTKEELFLGLLERAFEAWFDELDAQLAVGQGWIQASALADLVTAALAPRLLFRRLLALLGAVLEHNLQDDRALRFKWRIAGRLAMTGALLERRTVYLRPGDGARLLLHLQALAAGIPTLAEPAPPVRRILQAPGLDVMRMEFDREFRATARALLTGLERTN
jgi:AcrR family transcriptional regulator